MTVGARRGAAVLGSPIEHSLSPVLHHAAYDALGLEGWSYRAIECGVDELEHTLHALEAEGLAGVSLTMPLKRAVLPMLARSDRMSADVGGANTVLFGGVPGEWWGANTDVPGMVAAVSRVGGLGRGPACVLGGGATAAAALAALRELGWAVATVCVRRPEAVEDLSDAADRLGIALDVRPWAEAGERLAEADLVFATTPAGATDGIAGELGPKPGAVLFDVLYAPWPTVLAAAWETRGGRLIGGLELLVQQAARQVELMTGSLPSVDVMRATGEAALAQRAD